MKKKYLIEVEETNIKNAEVCISTNYKRSGIYINTDENGTKAIVFVPRGSNSYPIALFDWPVPDDEIISMLGEPLEEMPTNELEAVSEPLNVIDGATLIRAIAVAQNPELIKDMDL